MASLVKIRPMCRPRAGSAGKATSITSDCPCVSTIELATTMSPILTEGTSAPAKPQDRIHFGEWASIRACVARRARRSRCRFRRRRRECCRIGHRERRNWSRCISSRARSGRGRPPARWAWRRPCRCPRGTCRRPTPGRAAFGGGFWPRVMCAGSRIVSSRRSGRRLLRPEMHYTGSPACRRRCDAP